LKKVNGKSGQVILEYILLLSLITFSSIALLGFVKKIMKNQVSVLASKFTENKELGSNEEIKSAYEELFGGND